MSQNETVLTIGKVARLADIGIETIRFYERNGLIENPPRKSSGYRQYSPDITQRLRFIKQAKELGFTLSEIKELLLLKVSRGKTCADIKAKAGEKIANVEVKIKQLQKIRRALVSLMKHCTGKGPTSECPILDAFEGGGGR